MIRSSFLAIALLVTSVFSQSQNPSLLLDSDSKEIRINTADDYSLKTRTSIYKCENARASELAFIVSRSLSVYGKISVNDVTNSLILTDEESKLENVLNLCKDMDKSELKGYVHMESAKIPMKYNKASEMVGVVSSELSIEGRLQADDDFNVIFVNDHPSHIEKIKKLVNEYDVPQKQIVIDLEIVEIEKNDLLEYGIDWDNVLANGWAALSSGYSKLFDLPDNIPNVIDKGRSMGLAGGVNVHEVRDIIRIMQQKGFAKILSTPKVITTSGRTARLWYGQDIRYSYEVRDRTTTTRLDNRLSNNYSTSVTDHDLDGIPDYTSGSLRNDADVMIDGNMTTRSREDIDEERTSGLSLRITPTAGESDIIKISVDCELTNIIGWTPQETPIVSGQEINNDIIGYKDKTIMIGGLKNIKEVNVKKRIPVLGYILPFLFSRDRKNKTETDIAIFITPRIFDVETMAKASNTTDNVKIEKAAAVSKQSEK